MNVRLIVTCLLYSLLSVSSTFAQQPRELIGDRLRFNFGPCTGGSGKGSPEGVRIGKVCDWYIDAGTGVFWEKWSGVGNVGWAVGFNASARVNGSLLITGFVGHPNFVSGLQKWGIDDQGSAYFSYISADEAHFKSFVTDLEQALAGSQIICKSVAVLASNFTNPTAGGTATLRVLDLPSAENQAVYESGDYVGLRTFTRSGGSLTIAETFGIVTAYGDQVGGEQVWLFTRGSGANGGSMSASTVVQADGLAIDYGVSGNGCHEINAIDGANGINSPYNQTWTWTTSPIPVNRMLRTRVGNQRGITAVNGEYGLIAGTYAASNGQFLRATTSAFELHGIDLSLWQGATKTFFVDHAIPSLALGAAVPSAYGTGAGIWMGNDGGIYKFRAGIPNGAGLFWDGSTLTVRGTNGSGTNLIRNSECRVGTEDWSATYTTSTPPTLAFNLATWRLNDVSSTCYLTEAGTPANATAWFLSMNDAGARFPVRAGSRYEASMYIGLHRVAQAYQTITWYDSASVVISTSTGNVCAPVDGAGGPYLSGYCRSGVVATAPANAVTALAYLSAVHDGTGANPFAFSVRAFFGEATSTQTLLSDWGPAGTTEITGGLIRTGTILAQHIAANTITASQIAANTITASQIASGAINTDELAANSVTSGAIAAGSIDASDIAANTITAAQIAASTITTTQIAANTIAAGNMNVATLSAITANLGAVTAGSINVSGGGGAFSMTSNGDVSVNALTIVTNLSATLNATFNNGISIPSGGILWSGATGGLGGERYVCISNDGTLHTSTVACN